MIDMTRVFTSADEAGMPARERASRPARGRLRDFARWFLLALHESRRRQAEQVLRRHAHLFRGAGADRPPEEARAHRADRATR